MQLQTTYTEQAGPPAGLAGLAALAPGADAGEYLAFRLGALDYAVDIMDVQEIRSYEVPIRMAGAPDFMPGVLNLRGTIVPIVDLRKRLNLPAGFDSRTVLVVMNLQTGTVGLIVDAVSDVVDLSSADIQPVPALNDSADLRLFHGLVCTRDADRERTLIIMNLHNLLPRGQAALSLSAARTACPSIPTTR
ncbi:MAG: hypothetical protein JWP29_954 [Rhodoferax sp.]|nr:hypothetical protein [Rhodoferax sp.]